MAKNRHEGFAKAYKEATYLYIAYSNRSHLFKMGITKNTQDRLRNLNSHRPDDSGDWKYVGYVKIGSKITGIIESQTATSLKQFNIHRPFGGKKGYCRELYSCPLSVILEYLHYRLLPEERKVLAKSIMQKNTKFRMHNGKLVSFLKPTADDNLNPSSVKKRNKNKKQTPKRIRRTDLTPMAQMLQDKHNIAVYV